MWTNADVPVAKKTPKLSLSEKLSYGELACNNKIEDMKKGVFSLFAPQSIVPHKNCNVATKIEDAAAQSDKHPCRVACTLHNLNLALR